MCDEEERKQLAEEIVAESWNGEMGLIFERKHEMEDGEGSAGRVRSNDGQTTNRGGLTSARAARQLGVEAEQSLNQKTFLQSFLT